VTFAGGAEPRRGGVLGGSPELPTPGPAQEVPVPETPAVRGFDAKRSKELTAEREERQHLEGV